MFIFLSKFLPPLIYPLGLACLLIAAALLLHKKARLQRTILLLALLILLLGGNRWAAMALMRPLEWRYLPQGELPQADVIVVLGGDTAPPSYPRVIPEVGGAGDRLIYAAYLYRQGKAEHILFSSGAIEWLYLAEPAGENAQLLELMGVPRQAIWLESESRNTYENTLYSRQILEEKGIRRIILVTSAFHMPRSVALFEHQGLEVIPAPTDFRTTQADWEALSNGDIRNLLVNLLPGADNLQTISVALKEYLGILIYRLRGWL
jgi:uncharacterized SAM-binding protein YcdF (DUF218 family)